jgi:predicted CXXCH cytochrome family protein
VAPVEGGRKAKAARRGLALVLLLASSGCASVAGTPAGTAEKPAPKVPPAQAEQPTAKGPPGLAWVVYPEAEAAGVKDPHAYRGQPLCQRCHAGPSGALHDDPIALCKACHPQRHGNHPVGVVQKTPAKDLPYGEGGRVVCHTCHDQHDLKQHKKGLRLAFNDLCLRCHQQH